MKRLLISAISGLVLLAVAVPAGAEQIPHRINTSEEHYKTALEMEKAWCESQWESLGEYRITEFCYYCNSPSGSRVSASGKRLDDGMVAMNGVPMGSRIRVGEKEYIVADRCGINHTVDIWDEYTDGYCACDLLDCQEVFIWKGK